VRAFLEVQIEAERMFDYKGDGVPVWKTPAFHEPFFSILFSSLYSTLNI
jgi:hypothetical protein